MRVIHAAAASLPPGPPAQLPSSSDFYQGWTLSCWINDPSAAAHASQHTIVRALVRRLEERIGTDSAVCVST